MNKQILNIFEQEVKRTQISMNVIYNTKLIRSQIINIYFDSIVKKICRKLNISIEENYDLINQICPTI
jgi:hypothetical protein